jgi:L-lysine 6-transaminase
MMRHAIEHLAIAHLRAQDVRAVIARHMLADGFHLVADLDKSQGRRLVDRATGRSYLDFFGYFATQPVGHNHPALADPAFREHMARIAIHNPSNSDVYTEEMAAFVDMLARTAMPPALPHLFLVSGGALAVENALKAAFDWKFQKRAARGLPDDENLAVIHFREAFHGRSGYTISMTNTDPTKVRWFPKFPWPRVGNPKVVFPLEQNLAQVQAAEEQSLREIRAHLERDGDRIAALIVEPIQAEGGDNHFRGEFLRELRRLTREHELLFIVDEVQTGVGVTGRWWGYQHFDLEPDVLCFGKKMQVCGILAGERINEVNSVFKVSGRINSTWGGNLVDMVRATRYLQVIQHEGLVENAAQQGERLLTGLQRLATVHSRWLRNVRGRGLLAAFTAPSPDGRKAFLDRGRELGLLALACGSESIRFRPPLDVTADEVDEALAILDHALRSLS